MIRTLLAAVAGVVVWGIVASVLNLGLRHGWADYAAVEKAMNFTLPMMAARLAMSGLGSLAGGYVAARISREGVWAPLLAGVILLAVFVPYHFTIWSHFPIWYHLTFFASLPVMSLIGGRFAGRNAVL